MIEWFLAGFLACALIPVGLWIVFGFFTLVCDFVEWVRR